MIFDIKKLVSIFLLLAGVAGSFALIFSNSGQPAGGSADLTLTTNDSGATSPIPKNAFVEPVPQDVPHQATGQPDQAQRTAVSAPRSGNLTDVFTATLAQQIISNNPDGPQDDANGTKLLNLPTESYAADIIQNSISAANLPLGKKISDADIKILTAYDPKSAGQYFDSIQKILDETLLSPAYKNLAGRQPDSSMIQSVAFVAEQAYDKTLLVPVPEPLASIHKSFLMLLLHQKIISESAQNYTSDPLKFVLLSQNADGIVKNDLDVFNTEISKFASAVSGSKSGMDEARLPLFAKIFFIQKAEAWGIFNFDISPATIIGHSSSVANAATTHASLLKQIADTIYHTAVRVLVNQLINQLQNQVVNWVAGNGKPKFITDWQGFLADAGSAAAGTAIGGIVPGLCTGFGPLIRLALQPVPYAYDTTWCTLDRVVQNVQNFYDNFQYGGWVAYGAMLQPQNNFYGSLIIASDIVTQKAAEAQEAARNEGIASQGFLGVKSGGVITTPGSAIVGALNSSFGWKPNQISVASRLEELAAAVINAGINRVIGLGLSGISSALQGGSSQSVYQDLGSTMTGPGIITGSESGGSGGGINPEDKASILSQTSQLRNPFDQTIAADNSWKSLQVQIIDLLNKVPQACPERGANAQGKISQLQQEGAAVDAEIADTNTKIGALQALIDRMNATTDAGELASLANELVAFDGGTTLATANIRYADLQGIQQNAADLIANPPTSCLGQL